MKQIRQLLLGILSFALLAGYPVHAQGSLTEKDAGLKTVLSPASTAVAPSFSKYGFKVPLTYYGYSRSFRLSGTNAATEIAVEVYPGFAPRELSLHLQGTPNIKNGFLTIEHAGTLIASLQLPAKEDVWTIKLPANGLSIKNDQFVFSLRAIINTDDENCSAFKTRWVDVSDAEISFDGTPIPPRTVAEFFPKSLRSLDIFIGSNPNPQIAAAALELATFVQAKASGRSLNVTVQAKYPDKGQVVSSFDNRTVILEEKADSRTAFATTTQTGEWPVLMISSPRDSWHATLRPLADEQTSALLVASEVRSVTTGSQETRFIPAVSFRDLGAPPLSLKGVGEMDSSFSFSQSFFGAPITNAVLNLSARSSVLQKGGIGRLDIYFNDQLLQSIELPEDGGGLDPKIPIPNKLLVRDNTLKFLAYYTPPGGNCRVGLQSIVVDISKDSYISAEKANVAFPEFDHLPQALLEGTDVFIPSLDSSSLTATANLFSLLQRLSSRLIPINTVMTVLPKKIQHPLVMVSSRPQEIIGLKAFIQPQTLIVADAEKTTNLGIQGSFATLQTFFEDGFPVLTLTEHDWPNGLVALPEYLKNKTGWYTTQGNVMVYSQSGEASFTRLDPTEQQTVRGGKILSPGLNAKRESNYTQLAFFTFTVLLIITAILGFTYRSRQRKKEKDDDHSSSHGFVP